MRLNPTSFWVFFIPFARFLPQLFTNFWFVYVSSYVLAARFTHLKFVRLIKKFEASRARTRGESRRAVFTLVPLTLFPISVMYAFWVFSTQLTHVFSSIRFALCAPLRILIVRLATFSAKLLTHYSPPPAAFA